MTTTYKLLVIEMVDDISPREYAKLISNLTGDPVIKAIRYALGNDINNSKLIVTDDDGNITGFQG